MMETNTNSPAPAASKKEIGDALMMAAVNCAHVIDDDKIVLRRDAGKPGCSLAQLHERLADAMMIAMTARAATATSLVELREHLHGAAQAGELIVLAPEAAGALVLAMSTGALAGGEAPGCSKCGDVLPKGVYCKGAGCPLNPAMAAQQGEKGGA